MAAKRPATGYDALRPHAARILKLADFPTHVNGAYLDDPETIPLIPEKRPAKPSAS